ncbi:BatA domain-containing protein [Pelagicoccus sp. SDUM812003]|uniref:BatA domain-containing protein n=1 Tax=Pelagicoccus sp. SDUM812003 TaxID=3041267 RepID=UPI00280E83C6|nr:BatA domain-containing protein [Pelagicoccus sp. SDUM812003]MDQ8204022.1 BatA domain-containing protein [Pelagicoccus sp. SDUM812003]
MSFLAPLFLAGLALIAGPILFHLIRQAPRNRIPFSSTELLDHSQPKTESRRRIQNPLLLIIRCLVVALLALAFARPFFPEQSLSSASFTPSIDRVLLIDMSASMQRPGVSDSLEESVREILSAAAPQSRISIFGFSDTVTPIVTAEQWQNWPIDQRTQLALQRIAATPVTDFPTRLDLAIEHGLDELARLGEQTEEKRIAELIALSDFAKGSSFSGLAGLDWPNETFLKRIQVAPTPPPVNASLSWAGWEWNAEQQLFAELRLSLDSPPEKPLDLSVQAFHAIEAQPLSQPVTAVLAAGKGFVPISIPLATGSDELPIRFELSGDEVAFDNQLYRAPRFIPTVTIALLSDAQLADPQQAPYFIEKALKGIDNPRTRLLPVDSFSTDADLTIVDKPLDRQSLQRLRSEAQTGGTAFLIVSDSSKEDTLRALFDDRQWQIDETLDQDLRIGEIDFEHPLFEPFADPRFSNFANINTWKAPRIQFPDSPDIRKLASYDNGSPLLLEAKLGGGTVFVWAGDWSPRSSQWALSSKFVPFLYQLCLQSIGGPPPANNLYLDRALLAQQSIRADQLPITRAGMYQVEGRGNAPWLALQVDASESSLHPIDEDEWDRLGLPEYDPSRISQVAQSIAAASSRESSQQLEERQAVWKWTLWLVILLLLSESLLATKPARTKGEQAA